jgi:hypothetical protein
MTAQPRASTNAYKLWFPFSRHPKDGGPSYLPRTQLQSYCVRGASGLDDLSVLHRNPLTSEPLEIVSDTNGFHHSDRLFGHECLAAQDGVELVCLRHHIIGGLSSEPQVTSL